MKKKIVLPLIMIIILFAFTNCGKEKVESKNMEQIYKEEGVPVKTTTIKKGSFQKELTYNSVLSGIKESSASALIGGRIEKVLVKVGDYVKKDQVIVTFPADAPSAKFDQAKAAFENSKKMYERFGKLFEVGGVSAQDLDNIKTQYEVNKANWETVKQMIKVKAPISGYVTKVAVKESDNVKKKALLATISNLSKLKTSVQVSEDEISDVAVGAKAVAGWQGKEIVGKVIQVDMAMNPMTQSFNADLIFNNPKNEFKPGVTADIKILNKRKSESIIVERKDLIKSGNKFYAYVIEDGKAVKRNVITGENSGLFIEIVKGLHEGDQLVTEGQMFLDDQTKVKITN